MDKNKTKEIFEKMRREASEYVTKSLSDKPSQAGVYTISIENVRSVSPMTITFDGNNWDKSDFDIAFKEAGGDVTKIVYYDKKVDMEATILQKCGWNNEQLNFAGTMVHNVVKEDGTPIVDIVTSRTPEQVSVEWFGFDNHKIGMVYSVKENKIIEDKTDEAIRSQKDVDAFLNNINNSIRNVKGDFFPKEKLNKDNKSKLVI